MVVPVSLRLAIRELRAGIAGFRVFLACLVLGVAAIAAVGTLAGALEDGIVREGRAILGGDIELSRIHAPADPVELDRLAAAGTVGEVATLRAMARFPATGEVALVEVKAVDASYPMFGTLALEPAMTPEAALAGDGSVFGAAVDPTLLTRLGASVGDTLAFGAASLEIRATIASEPDRLSAGLTLGPRLLVSRQALDASGLVSPGSLVRWHYRVDLADDAMSETAVRRQIRVLRRDLRDDGWRFRHRGDAAPGVRRFVERLDFFLSLVGLTALIIGGVGIGNAVKNHLDRKRDTIATLKCLGATGGDVFRIYLAQVAILAAAGIAAGLAVGAAIPNLVGAAVEAYLPVPFDASLHWQPLATAAAFGALVTLAFAIWPLARTREIRPAVLFRDIVAPAADRPGAAYIAVIGVLAVLIAALAFAWSEDDRLTAFYVGGTVAAFATLWALARGLVAAARRLPRLSSTEARFAINNLSRPGAPTPSIVLSLGLGLALLATLALIDVNLSRELRQTLPERAPSFFFLDIQPDQLDAFDDLVRATPGVREIDHVPMLRGRIVSVAGVPASRVSAAQDVRWVLRGDRGVTYSAALPEGSRLVSGTWWPPDYDGPPLVSLVDEVARGLGVAIGDEITVNVLGRDVTATVANTRAVEWRSLGINFVLVFSPNALAAAPHTMLATVAMDPAGEPELLARVTSRFANVTAIRVKETLDTISGFLGQLLLAVRAASGITVIVSILVLAGALATGHDARIYDAVVLKTLGATRRRIVSSYLIEYGLLGGVTAVFAVAAGTAAAWAVVRFLLDLGWRFDAGVALSTVAGATALTVALGLAATWKVLGARPASVLRSR